MGMETVVLIPEPFGFGIYLFNVPEQVCVRYLLPVCTVEPFDISVLARFARLDILYFDVLHLAIVGKYPGEEPRPVVHPYRQRFAVYPYGLPEIFHDPYSRHGEVAPHAECLTVEVVHQLEHPEVRPVTKLSDMKSALQTFLGASGTSNGSFILLGKRFLVFLLYDALCQLSPPTGPQSFFSMMSFRIRWSRLRSAYICLSLRFSSCNDLSSLSCWASIPPYLRFQL